MMQVILLFSSVQKFASPSPPPSPQLAQQGWPTPLLLRPLATHYNVSVLGYEGELSNEASCCFHLEGWRILRKGSFISLQSIWVKFFIILQLRKDSFYWKKKLKLHIVHDKVNSGNWCLCSKLLLDWLKEIIKTFSVINKAVCNLPWLCRAPENNTDSSLGTSGSFNMLSSAG